jgi:hypothetical protein
MLGRRDGLISGFGWIFNFPCPLYIKAHAGVPAPGKKKLRDHRFAVDGRRKERMR